MDINKAIRKQEKSHNRFLFFLGFIFFVLPLILFLTHRFTLFFIVYLAIVEVLILTAGLVSNNNNRILYSADGYKLKLRLAQFGSEYNIVCEKVALVIAEGNGPEINIVLLTTSRFHNKKINAVDEKFLLLHPYLSHHYYKFKKLNPEIDYYYIIVSNGYYHKYRLLDTIYRNCVKAYYPEDTVEKIKAYRRF